MKRIGILTCGNTTGDYACSSIGCFEDFNARKGTFSAYTEEGAELVGVISCAGCPTLYAPEKIFRRVRTLAATGVEAVHLANCMVGLCPFKKKYLSLLREEFPQIVFVEGTHAVDPELEAMFVADFKNGVCSGKTIDGFLDKVMPHMLAAKQQSA